MKLVLLYYFWGTEKGLLDYTLTEEGIQASDETSLSVTNVTKSRQKITSREADRPETH
jgi:hypothetical protein